MQYLEISKDNISIRKILFSCQTLQHEKRKLSLVFFGNYLSVILSSDVKILNQAYQIVQASIKSVN